MYTASDPTVWVWTERCKCRPGASFIKLCGESTLNICVFTNEEIKVLKKHILITKIEKKKPCLCLPVCSFLIATFSTPTFNMTAKCLINVNAWKWTFWSMVLYSEWIMATTKEQKRRKYILTILYKNSLPWIRHINKLWKYYLNVFRRKSNRNTNGLCEFYTNVYCVIGSELWTIEN